MRNPATTMKRNVQNKGATLGMESCAARSIMSGVALLASSL